MPARIDLRDSHQIRPEQPGQFLDLPAFRAHVINHHPVSSNRRIIGDVRLKTFPSPNVITSIGNNVRHRPRRIAQRKVLPVEPLPAPRRKFHPVRCKKPVTVFRSDIVIPERPREHVVHLVELGEIIVDLDAKRSIGNAEFTIKLRDLVSR